jgi:hypothetical protein
MNYEILRSWLQQSHERLMMSLVLICIGLLSSVYWIFFALARAGLFSAKLDTKLTILAGVGIIGGSTCVGYHQGRGLETFGYTLALVTGTVCFFYWFIRWIKWCNGWL